MNYDELLEKINEEYWIAKPQQSLGYSSPEAWACLRAVVELHKPFEWNDALLGKIMVCDECCKKNTYAVTKKCQMEHEHGKGMPWCPNTIPAIERNLND